jgi:methylation protein EvaC
MTQVTGYLHGNGYNSALLGDNRLDMKCLVCESPINKFMTFGSMPIANGFLTESQFSDEFFFDMEVAFCTHCSMFQLLNQPEPSQMFNETYAFFSGTSTLMADHFKESADKAIRNFLKVSADPFVVEIGSNDGIMLRNFAKKGIRHLGIEPSANVAQVATDQGINTIVVKWPRLSVQLNPIYKWIPASFQAARGSGNRLL